MQKKNDTSQEKLESRNSVQLARRLVHMTTGSIYVLLYLTLLDTTWMIRLVATVSLLWYVLDRCRISYPTLSGKIPLIGRLFFREEEKKSESAAVAYQFAALITIILFPKHIACASLLTLAWADPMSALFGIRFGRHKFKRFKGKSYEGSLAYAGTCLLIWILSFATLSTAPIGEVVVFAIFVSFVSTVGELLPLPVDDNFSIPILTAALASSAAFFMQLPLM
jgi:dolichol kinase